jgi:membrane-bound lytic murein transglycosylase A
MTHIVRIPAVVVGLILFVAGCTSVPPAKEPPPCPVCPAATQKPAAAKVQQMPFSAIPGWPSASVAPGLRAFATGCARMPAGGALRRSCEAARALPADDEAAARAFAEATFDAWQLATADGAAEGMITGYYEPVLAGSRTRTERFRFPVYGVPADLVTVDLESVNPDLKGMRLRGRLEGNRVVPYRTRAEIEGAEFRAPILAWVEDPVELFFLQIQGSGQIALDGERRGERLRLGYGDQNGHPYRSLGRFLVDRREMTLDQASMQGIKAWAAANPRKLREALDVNPSYVFFRETPDAGAGPVGTLGVPLTGGYSIAVDPRSVPLGAPVFLATTFPLSTQPLQRVVAAQDTGGAIRGAVRADFYWGSGNEAGTQAGRMRQQGKMWILWPKGEAPPGP